MNDLKALNQRYETITWGAIFTWLAVLMFIPGDQDNWFLLGTGVILLALNLRRRAVQIATNLFSTIVGVMALVAGGISLLWPFLGIEAHYEVGFFPFLILACGLYLLIPGQKEDASG
jgi:hypothetical protein